MINKVHERALRVILSEDKSNFESLLQNNKHIYSHHENIQSHMIEMFKIKNELAPPIVNSMFKRRNESYNLRNFQYFLTERKRTVHYGLETLSYWSHNCLNNCQKYQSVSVLKTFSSEKFL